MAILSNVYILILVFRPPLEFLLAPPLLQGMLKERERDKRCIPKEGRPHAHKACQKKEKKKIALIQEK
jgi:hypothetical protein